jgi:ferredoxin-NADP reductase
MNASSCLPDPSWGRLTLICRRIIQETHDVKTFVFSPKSAQVGPFKAGQFIMLHLVVDGAPVVRNYSISSPPTRPDDLSVLF